MSAKRLWTCWLPLAVLWLLCAGCGRVAFDAGADGGIDGGNVDGGTDGGVDGSRADAGTDGSVDGSAVGSTDAALDGAVGPGGDACVGGDGGCQVSCLNGGCAVTGVRIIDPPTLEDRGELAEGQVLDLVNDLPSGFGLLAVVEPAVVERVLFRFDGHVVSEETVPPYAIGSNSGNAVDGLTRLSRAPVAGGPITLEMIPRDADGNTGTPLTRTLSAPGELLSPVISPPADADQAALDMLLVWDGPVIDLGSAAAGFMFVMVVPDGAAVSAATLDLRAAADSAGSCTVTIAAKAAAAQVLDGVTAADFLTTGLSTAEVTWDIPAWTAGSTYRSPDLSSIIAEVAAAAYFNKRILLVTRNEGAACSRQTFSQEGDPRRAARLYVTSP